MYFMVPGVALAAPVLTSTIGGLARNSAGAERARAVAAGVTPPAQPYNRSFHEAFSRGLADVFLGGKA